MSFHPVAATLGILALVAFAFAYAISYTTYVDPLLAGGLTGSDFAFMGGVLTMAAITVYAYED